MKGILLKDLYEAVCIKKNLLNWACSLILILLLTFFFRTTYVFLLNVAITAPLLGSSAFQFPMEQDSISNFHKIQLTFPVTKKEFILARYLLTFGFIGAGSIFSLILTLIYTYVYHLADSLFHTAHMADRHFLCTDLLLGQQCTLPGIGTQGRYRFVHPLCYSGCNSLCLHRSSLRSPDTLIYGQNPFAVGAFCSRCCLSSSQLSDFCENL